MKAVVVSGPDQFEVREVPTPTPGKDDVLVRVLACAICGSDLRLIRGNMEDIVFPLIPGHEWCGEVVQAPPDRQDLLGQMIVSELLQPCGKCGFCSDGLPNLCLQLREPGISVPGAFAEFIVVPVPTVHTVPKSVPVAAACMVEPLAVALYAMRRTPVRPGDKVLIFGGGGIGQLVAIVARLGKAASIVLVDHHSERLQLAQTLGADVVLDGRRQPAHHFLRGNEDLVPDVAFEASGSASAFRSCLEVVRPAGRVGVIGYSMRERTEIAPSLIMRKLLDVHGILSPTGTWDQAVKLVADGIANVLPLVTHRLPLDCFHEAFELSATRRDGAVRVLVEP